VGQVGHLLEVGPEHLTTEVADRGHHLQLLVEHHVQLVGLLAVAQELQQAGAVDAGTRVAVRAADRVHHGHPVLDGDVPLGGGADEGTGAGVYQERPVGAPFGAQQPAEDRERGAHRVALHAGPVRAVDDEVGTLAAADLVAQHRAYRRGVLLVGNVEVHCGQLRRRPRDDRLDRYRRVVPDPQYLQRCAVVDAGEAALAHLPVGHQGERGRSGRAGAVQREVGEPVDGLDRAGEDLDLVPTLSTEERERGVMRGQQERWKHRCPSGRGRGPDGLRTPTGNGNGRLVGGRWVRAGSVAAVRRATTGSGARAWRPS
jgi:hypothetical protein